MITNVVFASWVLVALAAPAYDKVHAQISLEPHSGYHSTPRDKCEDQPKIVTHKEKQYLCGTATSDEHPGGQRFVVALNGVDWQIFEMDVNDNAWEAWDNTYQEICGATE